MFIKDLSKHINDSMFIKDLSKHINDSMFIKDLSKWSYQCNVMLEINNIMFVSHLLHDSRY
jgi:hypothetical protein